MSIFADNSSPRMCVDNNDFEQYIKENIHLEDASDVEIEPNIIDFKNIEPSQPCQNDLINTSLIPTPNRPKLKMVLVNIGKAGWMVKSDDNTQVKQKGGRKKKISVKVKNVDSRKKNLSKVNKKKNISKKQAPKSLAERLKLQKEINKKWKRALKKLLKSKQAPMSSYEQYLNFQKKKRQKYENAKIKLPEEFENFTICTQNYTLAGTSQSILHNDPPPRLQQQMIEMFVAQDNERQNIMMKNKCELEQLRLSHEQEVVRSHVNLARSKSDKNTPLSFCSILMKTYDCVEPSRTLKPLSKELKQEFKKQDSITMSSEDLEKKWQKIKSDVVKRQTIEATTLQASQRFSWEQMLTKLNLLSHSSTPENDESHVPMIEILKD